MILSMLRRLPKPKFRPRPHIIRPPRPKLPHILHIPHPKITIRPHIRPHIVRPPIRTPKIHFPKPIVRKIPRPHIINIRRPKFPTIHEIRSPEIHIPKPKIPRIKEIKIPKPNIKLRRNNILKNEPKTSVWDKANAIIGGLGVATTAAELYMMSKWMNSGNTNNYGGSPEDYLGYDMGSDYGDYGYGDMGYGGGEYGDVGYDGGYSDIGYGSGGGYLDSLGDTLGSAASDYLPDSMLDPSEDIEDGTLTPTDDGGYVDDNGNYYVPDPETGELINPETGEPYIPKKTKYALIGILLILLLAVGLWIYKKKKKKG
ncbi:conserved protein of unknown function [Methanocaldococcus lauensis]|uniref:Uncharacterized protein n=1 Tax=Methanocaldococcus lauensis TaxID=2546128 RepID=A0A8D6SZG0_9EURY|nr:hypothetical protein [Methanocaldococcus lauensis]CAB3288216.1 conserved protein of unknown function [Methanocaldococcus lauensis]